MNDDLHRNEFPDRVYDDAKYHRKLSVLSRGRCNKPKRIVNRYIDSWEFISLEK